MTRSIVATFLLAAGLSLSPMAGPSADAQPKPPAVKQAPKTKTTNGRPRAVRFANPPLAVRNVRPQRTATNTNVRNARATAGATMGRTNTAPRRVRFRNTDRGVAGEQGSARRRWSMETNRPPVPTSRNPKRTTKRGANGKSKRAKSAKKGPQPPRARRGSDASVELQRTRRNRLGVPVQASQTLPYNAGAQGAAYRAIGNVSAIPTPQTRNTQSTYMHGKTRNIKSAKPTE